MRWTIGIQITMGFLLSAVLLLTGAWWADRAVQRQVDAQVWVEHTYQVKDALGDMLTSLREAEVAQLRFLITGREDALTPFAPAADAVHKKLDEVARLTVDNPREQERIPVLRDKLERRLQLMTQRVELRRGKGLNAALESVQANPMEDLLEEIRSLIASMTEEEEGLLRQRQAELQASTTGAVNLLRWGSLAAGFGLIALGSLIAAGITGPVRAQATALATTAVQLVAAAQEQQRVMSEQSTSVHETAASINELAASQRYVSSQATGTAELAARSTTAARDGLAEAGLALDGLDAIRQRVGVTSEQIVALSDKARQVARAGQIITEVTDQVNILALNAAVEAARAGEQGRGFAVVAAEVRRLADRTRTSAQQIATMMEDMQGSAQSTVVVSEDTLKTVEQGTRQASSIGELFESIASLVDETSQAADKIRLSCQEQNAASEQITTAMEPLSSGMQQTAAAAQQVTASASHLEEVARRLRQLVG